MFEQHRFVVAGGLLLVLLVLGVRAPLFELPLERDEGEYAYIGWRLGEGEIPYRDWFDQKPPGAFFAYRAAFALPGDPVSNVRLLAALFCAAASIALFLLIGALFGFWPGLLAGVVLAFQSADPWIQGPIANTELFMLPFVIASTIVFLRVRNAKIGSGAFALGALGVGFLLGIATLFKQVAGVHALLLLVLLPILDDAVRTERWRRTAHFAGLAALGGVLAWGPVLAWLAANGAFGAAVDAILLHNLDYMSAPPLARRMQSLASNTQPMWSSQGPALAVGGVGLALLCTRRQRVAAWLLGGWTLASLFGVSASGHFFPHYFQQLLPPIAAGVGACAALLAQPRSREAALRTTAAAGLAVLPLLVAAAPFWSLSPERAMRRMYPGNPFEIMPDVAREIAAQSGPEDSVFVFGTEPELYFYARRVAATRYIHLFPLFGAYADASDRQRAALVEIERARPAVITWFHNRMFRDPARRVGLVRALEEIIARDYRRHAVVAPAAGRRGAVFVVDAEADHADTRLSGQFGVIYVRKAQ